MRKTKTIKIDDLEISVKELRVKDIRKIIDDFSINNMERMFELLPMATDFPKEKLDDMAPSELGQIWDAFKEVNSFFFNLVEKNKVFQTLWDLLEKSGAIIELKDSIINHLKESFAESSKQDTPTASSTDFPSS